MSRCKGLKDGECVNCHSPCPFWEVDLEISDKPFLPPGWDERLDDVSEYPKHWPDEEETFMNKVVLDAMGPTFYMRPYTMNDFQIWLDECIFPYLTDEWKWITVDLCDCMHMHKEEPFINFDYQGDRREIYWCSNGRDEILWVGDTVFKDMEYNWREMCFRR